MLISPSVSVVIVFLMYYKQIYLLEKSFGSISLTKLFLQSGFCSQVFALGSKVTLLAGQ